MNRKWGEISAILEGRLAPGQGKVWIAPLMPVLEGDHLILCTRNAFVRDFVQGHFFDLIQEAVHEVMGAACRVSLRAGPAVPGNALVLKSECHASEGASTKDADTKITDGASFGGENDCSQEPFAVLGGGTAKHSLILEGGPQTIAQYVAGLEAEPAPAGDREGAEGACTPTDAFQGPRAFVMPAPRPLSSLHLTLPLRHAEQTRAAAAARNWRYSFEDFVTGPSNELAFAATHSMCSGISGPNVLFLSSPPGLGKTHLLQAAGRELCQRSNRTAPKVEYLTAEEFVTRFYQALKTRDTERFKARYREVDLFLLEDVHFLQGKDVMQLELLATVKALQDKGSKIAFSSSFAPRELRQMDEQLQSRLCSGFYSPIGQPDEDTRRRIFRSKALLNGVTLSEEVEDILARYVHADVRQIESCLHALALKARLFNSDITAPMAWEVLNDYAGQLCALDMDSIIKQVCKGFGVSQEQLLSTSRKQEYVFARNTAYFLARKHTDLSLESIGKRFNRRHTTVIKGITSLEREMHRQTPLGRQVAAVLSTIERIARNSRAAYLVARSDETLLSTPPLREH